MAERRRDTDSSVPPPDKSLTSTVEKLYVSQQHAFQVKGTRAPSATTSECKLCDTKFANEIEYNAHLALESHIVKEKFRIDRKSLMSKSKIIVKLNSEKYTEDIFVREGVPYTAPVTILNEGEEECQVLGVFDFICNTGINITWPTFPQVLRPGHFITGTLSYELHIPESYTSILLVLIQSPTERSYVWKEMVFRVQPEFLDDLKPSSPYKTLSKSFRKQKEAPIVPGEPLPPIPSRLVPVRKLKQYETSSVLRRILNTGLQPKDNLSPNDVQELTKVRSLLKMNAVTPGVTSIEEKDYVPFFRHLLYIEEHQMENDIHMYDVDDEEMQTIPNSKLLSLQVPGLSENRPSVLRGDSVYVMIQGNDSVKYEGKVHEVRESDVRLGFHKSFRDKFLPKMKLHVEYSFNRWPLRVQHRALEMMRNHSVSHALFPKQHVATPRNVTITTWFNKKIRENPQQQQAVRNIVSGTSYPAPYLIFGPPGTGKTVTVVEAITQLYHLHKSSAHLLVCAPSNSAANEVTKRLLISGQGHIPDSDVLRLFASSYNPKSIPSQLKKCCNYNGEFYYPSVDEIMQYAVVIVTLSSAGRLVTGGIPAGHFSHLFIDESSQAMEPETLVPVGGLFTSEKEKGKLFGQLVLAGDPKQLGPVLRSPVASKLGLGTSLLERLMNQCDLYKKDECSNQYNAAVLTKLVKNFRSHKKILTIPNDMFYDNELQACGDTSLTSLACDWEGLPMANFPLIFHGVKGTDEREKTSPSYFNVAEIGRVMKYVERLLQDRLKGRKLNQQDIGVITPYRKQVEKLKKKFGEKKWNDITVGTVEEFQGQERLVIIISTVRSRKELLQEDYKFGLGFLKNPKRFNVAMTRAKALLIIVGDPDVLQCDLHWRELILYCRQNGGYVGHPLKLMPLPQQMEQLNFKLSSLTIEAQGVRNEAEAGWRRDI
ncbi:putative helicase mov-10-B.1 isoform X2 [Periplaneta americana]|uniref:putative helicase mov-10-B.1 isoform X2 n=1 Tax=Periplaneta americana TaxID=6978 RepID=UPI0037E7CE64